MRSGFKCPKCGVVNSCNCKACRDLQESWELMPDWAGGESLCQSCRNQLDETFNTKLLNPTKWSETFNTKDK